MEEVEIWKEVVGFSRYKVSSFGRLWDTDRDVESALVWNGNYLCVNIRRDNGEWVLAKVHRIVALCFIENPEGAHKVVHKDEDRSNNNINNLAWKPKAIKEVKIRKYKTVVWLGVEYTVGEFAKICKTSKDILKSRMQAGWSLRECYSGFSDYRGSGYTTEDMWFPTKDSKEKHFSALKIKMREQKILEKSLRKQELQDYKKYGVGIFENFPIEGITNRVANRTYRAWDAMLARCYGVNKNTYSRYGAVGVSVCEDWHTFQNYAVWYNSQYKEEGWHVDKDILIEGNKIYSPDTCVLVPSEVNSFFATLPRGKDFGYRNNGKGYTSSVSIGGIKIQKYFKDKTEAIRFYIENKEDAARLLTLKYPAMDKRVIDTLLTLKL